MGRWGRLAFVVALPGLAGFAGTTGAAAAGRPTVSGGVSVLSVGDQAVIEGQTTTTPAALPLGLTRPLATTECVWFHTVDGSATGAKSLKLHDGSQDYLSKALGVARIAAGKTDGAITTTVNYDSASEPDESYFVVIDKITAASGGPCSNADDQDPNVTFGRTTGTVDILDGTAPSATLRIGDVSLPEGNAGTSPATLTVGLSAPVSSDECVWYRTIDGTATVGSDYRKAHRSVLISAGQTEATVKPAVIGDLAGEGDETFLVNIDKVNKPVSGSCVLGAPKDGTVTVGRPQGQVTILNDDATGISVFGDASTICPTPLSPTTADYPCGSNPQTVNMTATGVDRYGNNLGDVTGATVFSSTVGCTGNVCGDGPDAVPGSYAIQGNDGNAGAFTNVGVADYQMTCRGQHYDINGSITDGCEAPGSSASTDFNYPTNLGTHTCADTDTFTTPALPNADVIASDRRTHTNPDVPGFEATFGTASVYYAMTASGGTTCQNDVSVTMQITGSSSPTCYRMNVETNNADVSSAADGTGKATVTMGPGAYSNFSSIIINLDKTCNTSLIESVQYVVSGHL